MSEIIFVKAEEINSDIDFQDIDPVKLLKWCLKNNVNRFSTIDTVWEIRHKKTKKFTTTDINSILSAQRVGIETEFVGWEIDCN